MHLRLARHQLGQHAAQAQRVVAQRRPHPILAGGGGVALVEDQVDDLQHRGQAFAQLRTGRHLEGHPRFCQRAFGTHDALGHGRHRHQKGPGDLVGGEAAEQAQGQRQPRLLGEHRMAGGEDQAQQVVADLRLRGFNGVLQLAAQLLVLAVQPLHAPHQIDRAVLGGAHQPGARPLRDARLGPLLQRRHEGVLGQLFGQTHVAHDVGEAGDEARRLDSPDRLDRRTRVGVNSERTPSAGASGARSP